MSMRNERHVKASAVLLMIGLVLPLAGQAPVDALPEAKSQSVAELIEKARQALEAIPVPPEEVLAIYGQAKALLEKARGDQARQEALRTELETAPAQLASLKSLLDEAVPPPPEPPSSSATLDEVERLHTEAREKLRALEKAREAADTRSRELGRRVGEIPDEVVQAAEAAADARGERTEPLPADEPPGRAAAEELFREARVYSTEAKLHLLEAEREHAGLVGDVVLTELALAERQIDSTRKAQALLAEALKAKQSEFGSELIRRALEMEQRFKDADPVLVNLCADNVTLARDLTGPKGIQVRLREATERKTRSDDRLGGVQGDYNDIQERLGLMGLTQGIGNLLLQQREKLPAVHAIEDDIAISRRELNDTLLHSLQLREENKRARREGPTLQAALQAMGLEEGSPQWEAAREETQRILALRRELLGEVSQGYTQYQRVLSETIAVEQELLKTVEDVAEFVEEQVLWVRNMAPLGAKDFDHAAGVVRGFREKPMVSELGRDIAEEFRHRPVPCIAFLLAVAAWFAGRYRMRHRIRTLGAQVREHPPGTFRGTLETLLWTGVWGMAWPLLFWAVAWGLTSTAPNTVTTTHLAHALFAIGVVLVPLCLIRALALPGGLGTDHLGMDRVRLASMRKIVFWFFLLVAPLLFFSLVMYAPPNTEARMALGRLLGLGAQLLVALLAGIAFRRNGSFVGGEQKEPHPAPLYRYWWLWYPVAVGLPLVLAGASASGYDYPAVEIGTRIHGMALMVLGMVAARAVLLRGLGLFRSEMVRQKLRKSEAAEEERTSEEGSDLKEDLLREAVGHVRSVSARTAGLVRFGLWALLLVGIYLMWEDVLPAFRFLDRTTVYSVGDVSVTPANLLTAILAGIIAVFAVRTLPGILEMYVLSRSKMDLGERSAVATLMKYLLAIMGVASVGSRLGITWANMQWIVAALGVGLGFGLQEIVANLFSGVLMLIDGRIRPLDVVTVGDATGHVTAIRTLATTITDWNNREIVIPNKEFTSSRVINWTLSEKSVRLDLPVGIAYGSDTRKAEELLVRVGQNNEHTLHTPPPRALFLGFGGSSLDLQLHVWVQVEDRLRVKHELHHAIDDAFLEAGITIAFPQLDVHLNPSDDSKT